MQRTPKRVNDYIYCVKLNWVERIRDLRIPEARRLFLLLLFIAIVLSFYEDAKSQLLFRASQGTEAELISHWQYRSYQSALLIGPRYAGAIAYSSGLIVLVCAILVFLLTGWGAMVLLRTFSGFRLRARRHYPQVAEHSMAPFYVMLAGLIIIIPIAFTLGRAGINFSAQLLLPRNTLLLTLMGALAATVLAIVFGISSRLLFRRWLQQFSPAAVWYFLAIFFLQLIPPLCIVVTGFKWLGQVGYQSDLLIRLIWIFGHCFLTFPLLASFITTMHFGVKEQELQYLAAYRVPVVAILKYSFFKRFKAEYILTLLFAFSFIWNDMSLNMILSDQIPSFASNMQMLFIGRAADYAKATTFFLVALGLAGACILIWHMIIYKWTKAVN